ncbi:MAG: DR2241 family protein [Chthoniobacteraceae bacterium]
MRDTTKELTGWLEAGGRQVGQVAIRRTGDGWELRHSDDVERADVESFTRWQDARSIANADDAGAFRPLKTAPNLRHGWRLVLQNADEVRRALDYLYPAMLGVWLAHREGSLSPVDLRETLGRQTGMYRITQKISDDQAQRLIGGQCRSDGGCLKTILWRISPELPVQTLAADKFRPEATPPGCMPLLCHEACNLLIAGARKIVKSEAAATG